MPKKTSGPVRGHLYSDLGRSGHLHWYAEVTVGEFVVWADDCRDPKKLIQTLECTAYAFRRLQELGNEKFVTWAYQVTKAGKNL
jgi:hypothetical protein